MTLKCNVCMCKCVCVPACVRASVRACVRVCNACPICHIVHILEERINLSLEENSGAPVERSP